MEGGDDDNKTGVNEGRRRISKAAAASPILASLASPSVWGTVCSVSGLQSGNTSGHPNEDCGGRGCTPGYWKNHPLAWPPGFSPGTCKDETGQGCKSWTYTGCTPIGEILGGHDVNVFGAYGYNNNTPIMFILQKEVSGGGSTNSKLAHWIAAMFNAIVAPDIYGTSPSALLEALDQATSSSSTFDVIDLVGVLTRMNESGECFLSGGNKADNISCNEYNGVQYMYHSETGTCIPACKAGYAYDWKTKTCVLLGTETSYTDWCKAYPNRPECIPDWTP